MNGDIGSDTLFKGSESPHLHINGTSRKYGAYEENTVRGSSSPKALCSKLDNEQRTAVKYVEPQVSEA